MEAKIDVNAFDIELFYNKNTLVCELQKYSKIEGTLLFLLKGMQHAALVSKTKGFKAGNRLFSWGEGWFNIKKSWFNIKSCGMIL